MNKLDGEGKENNILDYNEFLFLYKIGIPQPIRNILWDSMIDNSCGITKDIYDYYFEEIKDLDFEEQKNIIIENDKFDKTLHKDEDELNKKKIMI